MMSALHLMLLQVWFLPFVGGFVFPRGVLTRAARCLTTASASKKIGVDYGLRRTGVCVGSGWASVPLEVIESFGNETEVAIEVANLGLREGCVDFVVGLPLDRDGEESQQSGVTRAFAQRLADVAALFTSGESVITLWDERYSSREAEALLAYQPEMLEMIDAYAACAILDDYYKEKGVGAEVVGVSDGIAERVSARVNPLKAQKPVAPPSRHRSSKRFLKYLDEE